MDTTINVLTSLSSFDYPNPSTRTLQKIHISLDQEYGLQLKDDIIKTLKYIDDEKKSLLKLFRTSMNLVHAMNISCQDKLHAVQYRYDEVSLLLKIQSIKRYSIEFNSKLNCTYLHSKVNNSNIQQKIIRPEHFERPVIQKLPNKKIQSNNNVNKHYNIVQAHYSSPWDGSEFKYQMVFSLHEKYKKKLIFDLFVCYRAMNMNTNQVITSYLRLKKKRILQICFSSILADALSSRYILFASEIKLRKLLHCKYMIPVIQKFHQNLQNHNVYLIIINKANLIRKYVLHKYGLQLLIWNRKYMIISRILINWSMKRSSHLRKLTALYAWISSYIKKNMLRKQLIQRYHTNKTAIALSIDKNDIDEDIRLLLKYHSLHNLNILRSILLPDDQQVVVLDIKKNKDGEEKIIVSNEYLKMISNISILAISHLRLCIQYKLQLPKLPFQMNRHSESGNSNPTSISNKSNNIMNTRVYLAENRPFHDFNDNLTTSSSPLKQSTNNNNNNNYRNSNSSSKLFNDALDCSFDQSSRRRSNRTTSVVMSDDSSDSEVDNANHSAATSGGVMNSVNYRNSFCIIKFHWLIKMSRRFIRILNRETKLHKRYIYCYHKIQKKYIFKTYWRSWKILFQKQMKSIVICDHIYTLKLLKNILHNWYFFSVERFNQRKYNIYQLIRNNRIKYSYKLWKYLYQERKRCCLYHRKLCLYKLQRIVSMWKALVIRNKYLNKNILKIRRKYLIPWFVIWHRKFHQRTLLKRVFAIRKEALIWRYLQQPNTFTRLYSNFQAWESYTVKQRRIRTTQNVTHKALYFRAASLLARYFVAWCKYMEIRNEEILYIHKQSQLVTKRYFTSWLQHIKQIKQYIHKIIVNFQYKRKQVIYKLWKAYTYQQNKYLPHQYYIKYMAQKVFNAWRTLRRQCVLTNMHLSLWPKNILDKRFQFWKSLYRQLVRYRKGFEVLSECYYNRKKRLSFMNWPGRIESIRARYLLQYFQQQRAYKKIRSRLVEQSPPLTVPHKYAKPITSFIEKKRPTLLERAMNYGYVESLLDFDSLYYYEDLLKTMLSQWSTCSKRLIKLRKNGFKLRYLSDDHLIRRLLRHWIFHTPRTSYRCVVWLIKPIHRAHDEYCRLQEKQNITHSLLITNK